MSPVSKVRTPITAALAAMLLLVPAATAFGAEDAPATDAAQPEAVAATEAEAQPAAEPAPTAQPAQDDVSGGNEYTEEAPPTATGDPDEPTTPAPDDTAPTPSAPSTGSGSAPTATTAAETTDTAGDELPRTGSDGVIIALLGAALFACGTLLRRAAVRLS
jgi:hypothetical protein